MRSVSPYCCSSPIGLKLPLGYCLQRSVPSLSATQTLTRTLYSPWPLPVPRPLAACEGFSALAPNSLSEAMLPLLRMPKGTVALLLVTPPWTRVPVTSFLSRILIRLVAVVRLLFLSRIGSSDHLHCATSLVLQNAKLPWATRSRGGFVLVCERLF